jgi:hypothetical protein
MLFVGLTHGCTHSNTGQLVTYELSGGTAGHAIVVVVREDGIASLRDRAKTTSITLNDQTLSELKMVCKQLPETELGKSVDNESETECCDQIVEQVTFQKYVYHLNELDEELAETFRNYFHNILQRGFPEDNSIPTSVVKEGGES